MASGPQQAQTIAFAGVICDGIRFQVLERNGHIHWEIAGPQSASRALDALYELPILVQDDEQAARLWASLDAASCGPDK